MHGHSDDSFAPKRRRHEEVHIDFTPMIDCMFLLLMFNMIAFVLAGSSDIDLPKAKYAKGNDAAEATVIILRAPAAEGGKSKLEIEGRSDLADPTPDDVKNVVSKATGQGHPVVVLKAEKKVLIRDLMEVAAQAGGLEGVSLLMAVRHGD